MTQYHILEDYVNKLKASNDAYRKTPVQACGCEACQCQPEIRREVIVDFTDAIINVIRDYSRSFEAVRLTPMAIALVLATIGPATAIHQLVNIMKIAVDDGKLAPEGIEMLEVDALMRGLELLHRDAEVLPLALTSMTLERLLGGDPNSQE